MAVGSYDANGIWNFGESDNIAPFSTTLNKLASSTSNAFTSAKSRIATLEANNLPGTIPVVPGSITKSGGTSSVTALGQVTATGVTSVTLNGVFTSAFQNYKVVMTLGNTTTGGYLYGTITANGITPSSSVRYQGVIGSSSGTVVNLNGSALSYFPICEHGGYDAPYGMAYFDIYKPQQAKPTNFLGASISTNASTFTSWTLGGIVQDGTAYDGFKVYSSGGATFTTVISVYGYNN